MKLFRIMNLVTRSWWEGDAMTVKEACRAAGWERGECWIREHSNKGAGGWKKVKKEGGEK